jgi:hypothetical protein
MLGRPDDDVKHMLGIPVRALAQPATPAAANTRVVNPRIHHMGLTAGGERRDHGERRDDGTTGDNRGNGSSGANDWRAGGLPGGPRSW